MYFNIKNRYLSCQLLLNTSGDVLHMTSLSLELESPACSEVGSLSLPVPEFVYMIY